MTLAHREEQRERKRHRGDTGKRDVQPDVLHPYSSSLGQHEDDRGDGDDRQVCRQHPVHSGAEPGRGVILTGHDGYPVEHHRGDESDAGQHEEDPKTNV
ncbi:MAG: hypothetical protein RL294_416 [Actinomycetota bacterium]